MVVMNRRLERFKIAWLGNLNLVLCVFVEYFKICFFLI